MILDGAGDGGAVSWICGDGMFGFEGPGRGRVSGLVAEEFGFGGIRVSGVVSRPGSPGDLVVAVWCDGELRDSVALSGSGVFEAIIDGLGDGSHDVAIGLKGAQEFGWAGVVGAWDGLGRRIVLGWSGGDGSERQFVVQRSGYLPEDGPWTPTDTAIVSLVEVESGIRKFGDGRVLIEGLPEAGQRFHGTGRIVESGGRRCLEISGGESPVAWVVQPGTVVTGPAGMRIRFLDPATEYALGAEVELRVGVRRRFVSEPQAPGLSRWWLVAVDEAGNRSQHALGPVGLAVVGSPGAVGLRWQWVGESGNQVMVSAVSLAELDELPHEVALYWDYCQALGVALPWLEWRVAGLVLPRVGQTAEFGPVVVTLPVGPGGDGVEVRAMAVGRSLDGRESDPSTGVVRIGGSRTTTGPEGERDDLSELIDLRAVPIQGGRVAVRWSYELLQEGDTASGFEVSWAGPGDVGPDWSMLGGRFSTVAMDSGSGGFPVVDFEAISGGNVGWPTGTIVRFWVRVVGEYGGRSVYGPVSAVADEDGPVLVGGLFGAAL